MGKKKKGQKGTGASSEEGKASDQGETSQSLGPAQSPGASQTQVASQSQGASGGGDRGGYGRGDRGGFGREEVVMEEEIEVGMDGGIEVDMEEAKEETKASQVLGEVMEGFSKLKWYQCSGEQASSKSPLHTQQASEPLQMPQKVQKPSPTTSQVAQAPIVSPPQPVTSSEDPTAKLSAIEKLSLKHRSTGLTPPIRKSTGKAGHRVVVETNHLPFSIKVKEIIHYDVSIEPDKPKKLMRFPAFDGKKNLYSSGFLEFGESFSGDVTVRDDERQMDLEFKVTVKFAARIDTTVLGTYMRMGSSTDIPQRAIQAIDVVLRSAPALRFTPVGRSYFTPPQQRTLDLGEGMELWYGFYQSAILGWKPFINVDGLKVNYEIPGVPNSRRTYKVNCFRQSASRERYVRILISLYMDGEI
ncbi:hypothetical protein J437_LFUL006660 [Ladona fulva]|uniref:Argonaute linker 1 domain-containing protein n=1 Tax=Ladona fulva TaxID=123851 RepID=A0A8K0K5K8_LADFU|nr:hypothetical protein J437_LFUL006660 [Ladona fulva]